MKSLIFLSLFAVALALPAEEPVPIVAQEMDMEPDGKFHWSYESADGTKQVQHGDLKAVDKDVVVGVHSGSYEYKGEDGQVYALTYTADENGYHPEGAHLPVAPPVPEPIARALAFLATARPPKE